MKTNSYKDNYDEDVYTEEGIETCSEDDALSVEEGWFMIGYIAASESE